MPARKYQIPDDDKERAQEQLVEEQREITYDTKDYTVELIVHKYQTSEYYVPQYQRRFVWDHARKTKFVESVLLGIPIPVLFGADIEQSGNVEIIDGAQRIQTLDEFLRGALPLSGLTKLDTLNGFSFHDLPKAQQNRFKNRTIRVVVLYEKADLHTRIEIFERINTSPLQPEPSEIRKGAFQGPFYSLVTQCAEKELFQEVCPVSKKRRARGEAEELVLRFFAYADSYKDFRHDVSRFLDRYVQRMNQEAESNPEILEQKSEEFQRMLEFASRFLPYGMAKRQGQNYTPRVRFEALSVGIHLALQQDPNLRPTDLDWLTSEDFESHVRTDASNSGPKLRGRIEYVRDQLLANQ